MSREDELPGRMIVARAILAAIAVTLVIATSSDLPCIDPAAVLSHLVRMLILHPPSSFV